MAEQEELTRSRKRTQKALWCLIGAFGAGIAVGVAIGFTVSTPAVREALGSSLGAGMGGVAASL